VAELVDALGLGPSALRHGGSNPSARTIDHGRWSAMTAMFQIGRRDVILEEIFRGFACGG
jgi:aromatic ring-opening dioxygenase catalytic subunit (LigB family)